jgi:NNP family nitrate/nitrite transporter-like MFS transporter
MNINGVTFRSQLGPLLFLTSIFCLNFIARIVMAPLIPPIEADLGVTHGEAGSLFLLISLGYFITLLGSGFVSSRLMHRGTIIFSATTVGLALIGISLCNSVGTIRLALLLLGMAAGLYLPSGIATLTTLISAKHWGKAIAVHELAPNIGFVTAPLICEGLLSWFSWRAVLTLLGGTSILVGIAFAGFGKGGGFSGEAPGFASFKTLFAESSFWIMIILFSLGISGTMGIYTMLPLYLVAERGIDRHWANTLIALSRISGLGMSFAAGWINDRWGPRRTLCGVFLLSGTATVLMGALRDFWIIVMVFLQPAIAACFFPPAFAALSAIGPPSVRNVAVSLTVPVAFIVGGGVIPTGIGMMGDAGSFASGIGIVGGLILMGFILSYYLSLQGDARRRNGLLK